MNRKSAKIGVVCLSCLLTLFCLIAVVEVKGIAQAPSLVPGLKENHCSQVLGAADSDILACQVWDGRPELFSSPRQIEIYRKGKRLQSIGTGAEIIEWHLWEGGRQIALHFGVMGSYTLFDTGTGGVLENCSEKSSSSQLPEWAKSPSERSDEAVPQGSAYNEQRTQWIAKLLRQTQTFHPGMKRKDVQTLWTTEGGLSNRYQKTYISVECPYIKLHVRFREPTKDSESPEESPDDLIESISQPYLEWTIAD